MPEFPETSESLIARVRDPSNRAAWDQFEQVYRPVVFRIARAKGLQHSDALDLVQQVLISVSSAIGRYEKHSDGMRFRNWLSRVTRNAILKALSRGPRDRATGGTEILNVFHEVPADAPTDALIELETEAVERAKANPAAGRDVSDEKLIEAQRRLIEAEARSSEAKAAIESAENDVVEKQNEGYAKRLKAEADVEYYSGLVEKRVSKPQWPTAKSPTHNMNWQELNRN